MSAAPAPTTTTASATSAGDTASQAGAIGTGNGTASALDALLTQSLGTDAKTAAAPAVATGAAPAAATPATTATASAAALTAAQLTAGAAVGAMHAKSDAATMAVSSPVGSSGWTDELGAKVTWMAQQGIQSASLQLSPEHLGPLQVTISVHDGQASVWFGAVQPDTRSALQQSLPQLRQLFASQGLNLADAGVSRESPRGQDRQQGGRAAAPVASVTAVTVAGSADGAGGARGLGLVDTYV
jgi:flagellar hook-length control protein FliK